MINSAELGAQNALVNEIKALRKELDELRTTPQPIGNGSLNYAVFDVIAAGPFTIQAGMMGSFSVIYAPIASPLYYDGKEAINRRTLERLDWSVMVDVNDVDHAIPYGPALAGPEARAFTSNRIDYHTSGRSDQDGQMRAIMQVLNMDTVAHDYWIVAQLLVPRPALKPQ